MQISTFTTWQCLNECLPYPVVYDWSKNGKQCLQLLCSPIICYFQEPLVLLELVGVPVESRKVSHHSVASVLDLELQPVPEGGQVDQRSWHRLDKPGQVVVSEGTVVLDSPAVLGVVDKDGKLVDRKVLLLLSGLAFPAATIKLLDAVRSWQPAVDGRKVDWAFRF